MYRLLPTSYIALGLFVALLPTALHAASLAVAPTASVRGSVVLLADVAKIDGTDAERQLFGGINLGAAPQPGAQCPFTLGAIRMRLRQSGIDPDTVTIDCPQPVMVTRLATVIPGAVVTEVAATWLKERLTLAADETMKLTPLRTPADVQVSDGKLTWQLDDGGASSSGTICSVNMTALIDGKAAWRSLQTYKVQRFAPVLVLKSAVTRFQVLSAADLTIEQRDMTSFRGTALRDTHDAVGQRAASMLAPGMVLTAELVQPVPMVKRNDIVQVQASCGAMMIVTTAIACEDGFAGDCIRVKNEATRQEYAARVLAQGRLEVVR